jgi:hypothetical protein
VGGGWMGTWMNGWGACSSCWLAFSAGMPCDNETGHKPTLLLCVLPSTAGCPDLYITLVNVCQCKMPGARHHST